MQSIKDLDVSHLVGREVGSSTILRELARGGMAIVFIAYQRTLKRRIAVKVLPKTHLTPKTAVLFQQEAEAAAILSHPNIIQIYEVGEVDEFIFFTMQLVQGKPLTYLLQMAARQVLPSKRVLPLDFTIRTVVQVLDALDYAHRQDIIHRDIKPDNVMIESHTQRPIITDFGLAKALCEPDEEHSVRRGTPLYMAPEQIKGEATDGRSDIYAAGTMLFQMLVPALPLPRFDSHAALLRYKLSNKNGFFLKSPSDLNPFLPREMDAVVRRAMAYDSADRFDDCREFREQLECCLQKSLKRAGQKQ
jgi:eukaryotic-like serine/threonine-protein kinase